MGFAAAPQQPYALRPASLPSLGQLRVACAAAQSAAFRRAMETDATDAATDVPSQRWNEDVKKTCRNPMGFIGFGLEHET